MPGKYKILIGSYEVIFFSTVQFGVNEVKTIPEVDAVSNKSSKSTKSSAASGSGSSDSSDDSSSSSGSSSDSGEFLNYLQFFHIYLDSDSKPIVTKQPSKQANLGATGGFADDDQTILNHLMSGK